MKKLLMSVLIIGLAAALMGGGVFAWLSDTETSAGNTFTGATMDLQIDKDGAGDVFDWVDGKDMPAIDDVFPGALDCLTPGQTANLILGIRNVGCCDGDAGIHFDVYNDAENGFAEPEAEVGSETGAGELDNSIDVLLYYSHDGSGPPAYVDISSLDGTDADDDVSLAELDCNYINLGTLAAGLADTSNTGGYIVINLSMDGATVGNEIMTDTFDLDIEFTLDQPAS